MAGPPAIPSQAIFPDSGPQLWLSLIRLSDNGGAHVRCFWPRRLALKSAERTWGNFLASLTRDRCGFQHTAFI